MEESQPLSPDSPSAGNSTPARRSSSWPLDPMAPCRSTGRLCGRLCGRRPIRLGACCWPSSLPFEKVTCSWATELAEIRQQMVPDWDSAAFLTHYIAKRQSVIGDSRATTDPPAPDATVS